jgi:hypothetical protein
VDGRHVVGHSGRSAGAANTSTPAPTPTIAVVVLGNYDTSVASIGETARQIIT